MWLLSGERRRKTGRQKNEDKNILRIADGLRQRQDSWEGEGKKHRGKEITKLGQTMQRYLSLYKKLLCYDSTRYFSEIPSLPQSVHTKHRTTDREKKQLSRVVHCTWHERPKHLLLFRTGLFRLKQRDFFLFPLDFFPQEEKNLK